MILGSDRAAFDLRGDARARPSPAQGFATPAAWLDNLVRGEAGVREAVLVLGEAPNIGPFRPVAQHPPSQPPSEMLALACERALDLRLPVSSRVGTGHLLALPILADGDTHGVVGLVSLTPLAPLALQEQVGWGLGWLLLRGAQGESSARDDLRERLMLALDLVMGAFDAADADSALRGVVTEAATRLGCDRVGVGLTGRGGTIRVAALSHAADFVRKLDLSKAIAAAMNEAAEQGATILVEGGRLRDDAGKFLAIREHQRLTQEFGSAAVLSVPFAADEKRAGVLVFEWAAAPVPAQALREAESLAPLLGRVMIERRHADRGIPRRVLDAAGGLLRRLFGPRHAAFKLSALALAATVAFFAIATGEHRVSANAELEGAVRRVIVAPFDGFVLTAGARAGEEVAAGAVLALLDDRELRLDAQRWSSQAEQFTGQANAAEAQGDLGQLRIAQAQIRQAEAQRNLALSQIERARIVAPFDGLVVSGDLSQQLGAGVRKGQVLFEVAPLDRYRIVLKVDERDMSWVSAGQRGDLVLAALSDLRLPFTVTLVTPVANATGGKNVFRVEATLDEAPAQLRPGMEGIGKIAIGERLLIWVWTHRFFDWLRLQAWIWLGV